MTDMKMQDVKSRDQFAGHLQGVKLQYRKYSVNRDYITLQCAISGCCYFLRHKHSNALCVS